ncbi:pheophytinase, chloroplastic-like [Impatiens glandulifera]|uniref:pheophytinase, chloroplastic-like n=1 Tax=Impatiens glandulifera TaxID=253017 RepID=UPI001FB16884|nr:pheophytinase, chloroplastic-like [Impatiens glandulifera]
MGVISTSTPCFHVASLRRFRFFSQSGIQTGRHRTTTLSVTVTNSSNYRNVAESREPLLSKTISLPGLPDDEDSEASISTCFWEWKPKITVHYQAAGSENFNSPAVLFLPGFGVGSFHYDKQLKDLGRDFRVWAIDFLGQGMSLPSEDPTSTQDGNTSSWGFGNEAQPWAEGLVYSIDLWRDQVQCFIQEVIKEPVYIVGNSLGGYVAIYSAAMNPRLVKGVTLLNATPFWGFLPNPTRSPRLARFFPWAGTFPLPDTIKKLSLIIWQKIIDPDSIAEILKQVYADQSTKVDKVFPRIVEITQHPAAAASFVSIMCAPQAQLSFNEALDMCEGNNTPICLVYGKEDPWVKPIWGHQVKKKLREAPYYQISPAGHCPHDELPEVVNYLLRGWMNNIESRGLVALPLLDGTEAREVEYFREGSRRSASVQFFGSRVSLWSLVSSYLKSRLV